jgi:predicted amidohydrolase YtcJ
MVGMDLHQTTSRSIANNQEARMRWPFRDHTAVAFAPVLIALTVSIFCSHPSLAEDADTILLNGKILTLDQGFSIAEALAIRAERIVAVGASKYVLQQRGDRTRIIDLGGRTVIPGLIDSHIHAIRAGFKFSAEVSWIGTTSIDEAMERIRFAAKYAKPGSWIVVGGGWTPNQFVEQRRPTQTELVAAAPDHPVYVQLFYRAVLLTPAGLKALGIEDDADLPASMKFDRGADGRPNGWISGDSPAITGLYSRLPRPRLDESMGGTRRFLRELNRYGITGVIDPGGHNLSPEDYEPLFRLWRAGELSVRISYSICAPRPGSELADLQTLTRFLPMAVGDRMLRFNGIGERLTWGMYNNDTPTEAQKEELYQAAHWAAERGMTVTAHWNNERSVHHLLDVYERVDREISIRELRWSVAHLHDASELSLTRMKALGVGWLMQNGLYFAAPSFLAARGSAINRAPPIKTALRIGLRVGGGTDADRVMSYNPFVSLKWMVDGRTVDGMPTRSASELISREEALRIYTSGSAWFAFDEDKRGTLEIGRLADLAVLDRDYLTVPTEQISALTAVLTMVGGRIVHAASPFDDLRPNWEK